MGTIRTEPLLSTIACYLSSSSRHEIYYWERVQWNSFRRIYDIKYERIDWSILHVFGHIYITASVVTACFGCVSLFVIFHPTKENEMRNGMKRKETKVEPVWRLHKHDINFYYTHNISFILRLIRPKTIGIFTVLQPSVFTTFFALFQYSAFIYTFGGVNKLWISLIHTNELNISTRLPSFRPKYTNKFAHHILRTHSA